MSGIEKVGIEEIIKQELEKTEYSIELTESVLPVNSKEEMVKAEGLVKVVKSRKNLFTAFIKPFKSKIDGLKNIILDKEKSEIARIDSFINEQEKIIDGYKTVVLAEQRKLKAEAERLANEKAEAERLERVKAAEAEKARLEKELEEIAKNKPLAEVIDEIEIKKAEIASVKETVIPEIVIEPEKVILKKDEIKTKIIYSISDEKAYINWAIKNSRTDLLEIKVSKSGFNALSKTEEIKNLPFISKEEVIG